MGAEQLYQQFITDIQNTHWYEYIAVFSGIASVWYSRKENILVYPVGLINTIIYVYISFKGNLFGEAGVNFYYTVMSIIGWYMWLKKDAQKETVLHITSSNKKDWLQQISFFLFFYISIFLILTYFKKQFYYGVIPWADAFASATAFTGMWLMTKKKVESWYWWIATNIASIPLYFVKHYVFTSVYYVVLLVMAVAGLFEWMKKQKLNNT
ncbi:nicotinamide riboside transporter PnuC [Ferruginibacter sp.]|nr:nicotinamide mononucleotide transporter [Ferruginibacter sp.]